MDNFERVRRQLKAMRFEAYDAYIERAELKNGEVAVNLRTRKALLNFRFGGVVYFKSFEFGGDLSEIRVSQSSAEIAEALRVIENDGGKPEGYPDLIQVAFVADAPVLIVVFQTLVIEK